MDDLLQKISHYGYPGLFLALVFGIVGIPIPDETLLVFFGYLAYRGSIHLGLTWITAFAGSVGGITASYWIGRWAGYGFVHRFGKYIHFTEDRLTRILLWFDKVGHWLLTFGYFIPGVRHFTALVAGMSGVSYRSFAVYAYSGALLWVSTFISVGYFLGEHWRQAFEGVHRDILIGVLAIIVVGWIFWKMRSGKQVRPPSIRK